MAKKQNQDGARLSIQNSNRQSFKQGNAWPILVVILLFSALVFLIYSHTLRYPFAFDDFIGIKNEPAIRLTKLTPGSILQAARQSHYSSRPVGCVSFAINYYFNEYNVVGYRFVNITIHILAGIFLYLVIKTTLHLLIPQSSDSSIPLCSQVTQAPMFSRRKPQSLNLQHIAFFCALIWLVHPIQTQSVTYIIQRMTSMASMFYILSVLLYIRGRLAKKGPIQWSFFTGSALAGLLAIGSKQMAATLPLFLLLYEWYFFRGCSKIWIKQCAIFAAGALILLAIIVFLHLGTNPIEAILLPYEQRDFTMTQRLLSEFRVVVKYISLLVLPHPSRLNLDHHVPISTSLIHPPTTLFSIGIVLGLISFAVHAAKKRPFISFSILWFFGNLAIESSFLGLELMHEHRLYLPSMLAVPMLVTACLQQVRRRWFAYGLLCSIIVVFSLWTYERNFVWKNDLALWKDSVAKSKVKARPHNNFGRALAERRRSEEAIAHFSQAVRINPDFWQAHDNLGLALAENNKFEEAIKHFHQALSIQPNNAQTYNNLGLSLAKTGNLKEAIKHFSQALQIEPNLAEAHNNMGLAMAQNGNFEDAIRHYSKAISIKADYAEAYNNLGRTLENQGRSEEAMNYYNKALQIKSDYAEVHYNMGSLQARQEIFQEAVRHYSEALRIRPNHARAHSDLGLILTYLGDLDKAISHFLKALEVEPGLAETHNNLGAALAQKGHFKEAIRHYSQALCINPDYAKAHNNLGLALAEEGSFEKASYHFLEALRINPNFKEARDNLTELSTRPPAPTGPPDIR